MQSTSQAAGLKYKRILLKLSGESLMGGRSYGIAPDVLERFSGEVAAVHDMGVEIGIVIGGGNIYRGIAAAADGVDKVVGDQMGMLATVINSLALQNVLEKRKIYTRLMSAITMEQIAEPFIRRRAIRHLEKETSRYFRCRYRQIHYFTTDTGAVLRAVEIRADVVIKGTRVDGIYDSDPEKNPAGQVKFPEISYMDVLQKDLKVMDMTAITLCQ